MQFHDLIDVLRHIIYYINVFRSKLMRIDLYNKCSKDVLIRVDNGDCFKMKPLEKKPERIKRLSGFLI